MRLYPKGIDGPDAGLWDAAVDLLSRTYRTGRHEVAAAIRLRDGRVVTGVHVQGFAGRSSVCAEGMALGAALVASASGTLESEVDTVLAVLYRPTADGGVARVIAPCGVCRELLHDHCADAAIYVHVPDTNSAAVAVDLSDRTAQGFATPPALSPGEARRTTVAALLPATTARSW